MILCAEQGIAQAVESDCLDAERDVQEAQRRLEDAQKQLEEIRKHRTDVRARLDRFKESYTALAELKSPKRHKPDQQQQ